MQNSLGPQSLSTLPSSPISGFGTAKRPSMATKSGVPGPGAYKLKNTVGMLLPRNACFSHALYCVSTLWFSVCMQAPAYSASYDLSVDSTVS